jgi:hypothetical protein
LTKQHILKKHLVLILLVLTLILACNYAQSLPSLPTEFYGRVREYNLNATSGQVITAHDSSGDLCGAFTIVNSGFYGTLTCKGDDPESGTEEGAAPNEEISFRYNGAFATVSGNTSFEAGRFKNINITFPVVFCGDLFCDAEFESNFTCSIDCPVFNQSQINVTINTTINTSNNQTPGGGTGSGGTSTGSGGGGAGGAGGGAGSSGSSAGGSSSTPREAGTNVRTSFNLSGESNAGYGVECIENWVCGNWTICQYDSIQNRSCRDINKCDSFEQMPPEVQKCTYLPKCNDGIKNGIEEGVDCGGLCSPCINCFDGVQNCHDDGCEEQVDCGGPCKECPNCFDGLKNGGEQGVDCGGTCDKECPTTQAPTPIFLCKKDINPFNNEFFIFFIIVSCICLGVVGYSERKVYLLKKSRTFKGIERARKIYSARRKEILFCAAITLVAIIVYLFYYMFIMCDEAYNKIWILIVLLLASPILIHQLLRYLEYDEQKKISKLMGLESQHKKQIEELILLETESIIDLLVTLKSKLGYAIETEMYEKTSTQKLKQISSQVTKCIDNYKAKTQTDSTKQDEEELMQALSIITEDVAIKKECEKEPALQDIMDRLKSVGTQLDEKKKLYEELKKAAADAKEAQNSLPQVDKNESK